MKNKKSYRCSLHNFLKIYKTCLKNNLFQEFLAYLKENNFSEFLLHLGKKGEACNGLSERETIIFANAINKFRHEGFDCTFEEGFTPEQALDASRKLNDWATEIKNAKVQGRNLSVLEKFLYAYDISSNFVYKKNDLDENGNQIDVYASRNVVRVLNEHQDTVYVLHILMTRFIKLKVLVCPIPHMEVSESQIKEIFQKL